MTTTPFKSTEHRAHPCHADARFSGWKYISVRRMALFIERSLAGGLGWAVLEPNGEPLRAGIRQSIGNFMRLLFRSNAFQGVTPRDAYFVRCGAETTTPADIDVGIVNVESGLHRCGRPSS